MRSACVFPGQGAYLEDTFLDWADRWPQIGRTFRDIDDGIAALGGVATASILLGGDPPSLNDLLVDDPDVLQLALFGTAVAAYRIVASTRLRPDVLVGHSLGEIAALVAAGVFTIGQGARIVHIRSRCLRAAVGSGGMLVLRTGPRGAQAVVDSIEVAELVVAVENGPRQTVLAGPAEALRTAEQRARANGVAAARISSPYPFHSPLLEPVAAEFTRRLRAELATTGRCLRPVYSPIMQRFYTDDDDFAEILARHLVLPVRFTGGLRYLGDRGVRTFIECGARDALTGIVRATLPGIDASPTIVRGGRPASAGPADRADRYGESSKPSSAARTPI